MQQLRFALLARVSTEAQAQKGESLQSQVLHLQEDVFSLGGIVAKKYVGQEHATEGSERLILDQLLDDSSRGLFDAVIVWDTSRLGRDKRKSWDALETFKRNGIRYFARKYEYDLFNPEETLRLGFLDVLNQYAASKQAKESLLKRIDRARRGIPTSGKLPYGRTFDRKTGEWGLNAEAKQKIEWAAEQYLRGESMAKIAKKIGMNHSFLWNTLKKRCGDTWTVHFSSPRLSIKEQVDIAMPRLLTEDSIVAIHDRLAANKTFCHGQSKNKYLLGRMVICAECGYAMFGQRNTHGDGKRYYRHIGKDVRSRKCPHSSRYIGADILESSVLIEVFEMYGDINKIETAMQRAIPDMEQVRLLEKQREGLLKNIQNVDKKKINLINAIANGVIVEQEASDKMQSLRDRDGALREELLAIEGMLKNIPSAKQLKVAAKVIRDATKRKYPPVGRSWLRELEVHGARSADHLLEMDWDAKRKLLQRIFAGKDAEGRRLGVYVRPTDNSWQYTIRGVLGQEQQFEHEFNHLWSTSVEDYARSVIEQEIECEIEHQKMIKAMQSKPKSSETINARSLPDKALRGCRTRSGIAPPAA